MAIDMIFAGLDPTTKAAGAVLYFLAKNPRAQNKLRAELLPLLPSKDSPVTKEVLKETSYLKAVIKETMRLAPVSVGNVRRAQKDMVIAGYQIPKGTQLITSNLLMSRRDFPKSEEFMPERWLRSTHNEYSHKKVNPFTSMPFGFGPRSCVGKRFANLEIETLVSKVIRNFKLEWHHPDLRFKQSMLYTYADPLKLTVYEIDE